MDNNKDLKDLEKDKQIENNDFLSWAETAKEDLEEFIEEQGIYIRQ